MDLPMEIDTGSSVTLLNKTDFINLGQKLQSLKPCTIKLRGYKGDFINCVGEKYMSIQTGNQKDDLLIHVVDSKGPSLIGRDFLGKFKQPWKDIFTVNNITSTASIVTKFPSLFDEK
jgi:hypothetical protein